MWKPPEGRRPPPWYPALSAAEGGRFPGDTAALARCLEGFLLEHLAHWKEKPFEMESQFAGRCVRIRIGGTTEAEEIAAPFVRLCPTEAAVGEMAMQIDLWDLGSAALPAGEPCSPGDEPAWFDTVEKSSDRRYIVNFRPNSLACLDRLKGRISALGLWRDTKFLYEMAKPLAIPLVEWHNDRGVPIIHGGLVSLGEKGVFLGGMSGSGKSTTALACFLGGFDFLGEDFTAVEMLNDGGYRGHGVYSSVFLETEHLEKFHELNHLITRGGPFEEKSVVLLSRFRPASLRLSVPIRALAVCRVGTKRETVIRPLERSKALLALAPTCIFQVPSAPRRVFDGLTRVVQDLPVFQLETGRDLQAIAPVLARVLEEL